jgi:hypothetical protein
VNVMLEMKARVEAPEGTDKSGSIREMYPPTRVWKEVKSTSDHFYPDKSSNRPLRSTLHKQQAGPMNSKVRGCLIDGRWKISRQNHPVHTSACS